MVSTAHSSENMAWDAEIPHPRARLRLGSANEPGKTAQNGPNAVVSATPMGNLMEF